MPRTKTQKIVFGILMALIMVYGMEVYNSSINAGGLSNSIFFIPLNELILLSVCVIVIENLIGGPLARKLAFRLVDPKKDRPILIILAVSVMTVCCMCPMMSLVATIVFKGGLESEFLAKWIQTVAINFPMAFCWQIFIAGPSVRFVFRKVFAKQLVSANN